MKALVESGLADSPLYILATLVAARRSGDLLLERAARKQLEKLNVTITFGKASPRRVKREASNAR